MKPQNETQRLEALKSYQILDSLPEEEFDRLTELASLICDVPITLVSLIDSDRQWFKSKVGLGVDETPRDISFCQFAIFGTETFTVEDASQDERFKNNPLVTGAPDIRFYAGQPLIDPNGYSIGTLCVIDRVPRKLDSTQQKALQVLAKEVVAKLVARKERLEKEQYESLFNMSFDIICVATTDGLLKTVNPSFLKVLGWDYDELSGKPFADYIHPDDLEATFAVVAELAQGAKLVNFVNRYRTSSGDYKSINWCCNPDVNTGELYAIGRDVTEVLMTQKKLQITQNRLLEAQRIAKLGNWEYNFITNSVQWSDTLYDIFEIDKSTPSNKIADLVKAKYSPEDQIKSDNELKIAIETGLGYNVYRTVFFDDGKRYKYVFGKSEIVKNEEGQVIGIKGTMQDVTESRQIQEELRINEERWAFALDASGDGIWDWSPQNKKTIYSSRWANIIGYELDELTSSDSEWSSRLHPDDLAMTFADIGDNLSGKTISFSHEYRFKHKNGDYIWILNRGKVVERDFKGEAIRVIGTHTDINDRKLLEFENIKTQERLKEAQILSKIGNWEFKVDTNEILWSDELYNIFNIDIKCKGNELYDLYSQRHEPSLWSHLQMLAKNTIETGEGYELEHQIQLENNQIKYIYAKGTAVRNLDGKIASLVGIAQDITERKIIEIENQKNQQRLKEAQKLSKIGSWEIDLKTNERTWSDEVYIIYELEKEENENKYEKLKSRVHPTDFEELMSRMKNSATIGDELNYEFRCVFDNGNREKIFHTVGYCIKNNDNVFEKFIGTTQDITERKNTEKELALAKDNLNTTFEAITEGIVLQDIQGNIIACNPAAEKILGLSREQMEGKKSIDPDWRAIHEDGSDYPGETHPAMATLTTGVSISNAIMGVHKPNNEITWININSVLLPNNRGVVCSFSDITDAKIVERDIIHAKNAAEAANVAKSEFLANMSHEIRTPLNGVIGFTDLLLSTELDSTQKMYVNTVNNSAKSLLDIINDILDFSKIEAGKLEIENEKNQIDKIISEASNIVEYQCQSKNLSFLLNISPELPTYIWTDKVRLRQILVNLLSNAIKFTSKGEVELAVLLISKSAQLSIIRFEIRDTGVGILPENINKIFNAFSQEDTSTTRKYGGTGLGLTISNKLLSLMNSTPIQVESQIGVGSKFYFDVNFESEYEENEVENHLEFLKEILVVDSNAKSAEIINSIAVKNGIKTNIVSDGIEALYKLKTETHFDAIIIDNDLPDMTGLEIIKKIRKNSNLSIVNIPIILIYTANDDSSLNAELVSYGIKQQIQKPITKTQLITALVSLKTQTAEEINVPADETTFRDLHSKKVLIVDDNKVNTFLAKAIIEKLLPNSYIEMASDGFEAIEKFNSFKPHIIFMDIQMPNLNGYEASIGIRKLETDLNRVPIIPLTAGTVLGEKERCLAAGMDDYVSKPFVKETIAKMINDWLD